jgi:hypothetical protein
MNYQCTEANACVCVRVCVYVRGVCKLVHTQRFNLVHCAENSTIF